MIIETARLRLRPVDEQDAAAAARLMTPAISRWLASWPAPLDEALAATRLRGMREAEARGQGLCFAIEQLARRDLMGFVMIFRSKHSARRGVLGYWLAEAFHRQGYMVEAADAAMTEAFAQLDLLAIEAGAQPDNVGSLAVMRRLGMRYVDERPVWAEARGREEICVYYAITRDEHAAQHA